MDATFYAGQDLEALADIPRYNAWAISRFRPFLRGRVIEVGAGTGNVARLYAEGLEKLVLLEPAQNLHAHLRERFSGLGHVEATDELLSDYLARWKSGAGQPFDAAVSVNVLEHVQDDAAMLSQIFELLRPGGALLLFVPALPWLFGTLDECVHHLRRYTRASLGEVVEGAGFEVEELRYLDLPGVLPWFLTGRVLRQRGYNATAAKAYDRLVVPPARLLESWVAPPLGKNLVCVARRRAARA